MNFGVISTANIGRYAVVPAIAETEHEVLAVGSRNVDRAAQFADELGIDRHYGSYEELLDDPDLDAVYNPLPNSLHAEWTKAAADRGLHVLCEKPLGVDATEATAMGAYCDDAGVTLMEAFMYRYHPRTERVQTIVSDVFDEVRSVEATFQFPLDREDDIRLDPDLAGGSLMDVGCYAVSAVRTFLGEPDRVFATATDHRDCGVETQLSGLLAYDDGRSGQITSSFDTQDVQEYRIEATNGWLRATEAFVPRGDDGVTIEYTVNGRTVTEAFDPTDQYRREVDHFADCVRTGRRPRTDADEAITNMTVIEALYESADRETPVEVTHP